MDTLKKILVSPYTYIFLAAYYGVWLLWDSIKIPFHDPAGIISYLPLIHYNPANNILRFLLAVLLPPLACLVFWTVTETTKGKKLLANPYLRRLVAVGLLLASLTLAVCMGALQGSTNPINNPKDAYGGSSPHAVLDTFHEGESLGPAVSYSHKELKPYRDFVIVHGVFQDPLNVNIAFKIFGRSIGAARTFGVLLVITAFLLYYLLLLVLFRGSLIKAAAGLSLLALLLMPGSNIPIIGHSIVGVNLPFRDFATIFFLIAAIVGLRSCIAKRPRLLVASSGIVGLIATASFANSIDRALYIFALSIVWLAMIFIMLPARKFWQSVFFPYVIGCLAGTLILGLALKWAFKDFFVYLLTMSRYKEYLDGIIFGQPNSGVTIVLLAVSVCLFIGGAYLLKLLTSEQFSHVSVKGRLKLLKHSLAPVVTKHYTVILLFATAIFFLRSAIGRSLPDHFSYSVQWLYLLFAYMLINYAFSAQRKAYHKVFGFIIILVFGFTCLNYAHAVKALDLRENTFPLHIKDKDLVRSDYQQTANYLQHNLHGQETFVTLTSEASWYYLVNKPSPIPYDVIWYAFTSAQRQKIAQPLATNTNIKYVITNNNWTSNFDYVANPDRFPEVYKVLNEKYVPYKGFGQQTIWIRK